MTEQDTDVILSIVNKKTLERYEHVPEWVLANDQEVTISWQYNMKKPDKKDNLVLEGFLGDEKVEDIEVQKVPTKGKSGEGTAKVPVAALDAEILRVTIINGKGEMVGNPVTLDIASQTRIAQKEAELAELAKRMQAKFVLKTPLKSFAWQHDTTTAPMVYASQKVSFQYAIREGSEEPLADGDVLAVAVMKDHLVDRVVVETPITSSQGNVTLELPLIGAVDNFSFVFLRAADRSTPVWQSEASYSLFSRQTFQRERALAASVYMTVSLSPAHKTLKHLDGAIAGDQPINVQFTTTPGSHEDVSLSDTVSMWAKEGEQYMLLDQKSAKGLSHGMVRFQLPNQSCVLVFSYALGSAPSPEHWIIDTMPLSISPVPHFEDNEASSSYLKYCDHYKVQKPNSVVYASLKANTFCVDGVIDLSTNYLTDKTLMPVLEMVALLTQCHTLILKNLNLRNHAVEFLIRTLCHHDTLATVDLRNNMLSEGAVDLLANWVVSSPAMKSLLLDGNPMAKQHQLDLQGMLQH